jgi:hypothetical protein
MVGDSRIYVPRGSGIEGVGRYPDSGESVSSGGRKASNSQNPGSAAPYYRALEKIRNPRARAHYAYALLFSVTQYPI